MALPDQVQIQVGHIHSVSWAFYQPFYVFLSREAMMVQAKCGEWSVRTIKMEAFNYPAWGFTLKEDNK